MFSCFGSHVPILGIYLVVISLGTSCASVKTKLQWDFKQGQSFDVVLDTSMTSRAMTGAMAGEPSRRFVVESIWTVKELHPDGTADLVQKATRIRFRVEIPDVGVVEYDSKEGRERDWPLGYTLNPIFDAILEGDIAFTMSSQGNVGCVELSESIRKAYKRIQWPEEERGMFSEDYISEIVQLFPSLPVDAIPVGKSWNQERTWPALYGAFLVENVYTYMGTQKKDGRELEKIAMESSMTFEKQPDIPLDLKLEGRESPGVAYFDSVAGRFVEVEYVFDMVWRQTSFPIQAKEAAVHMTTTLNLTEHQPLP